MAHFLIRGDARRLPLADGSVHCCACSPPFFGLRSYLDADDPAKALEIGTERSPDEFVAAMRVVAREVWRVLRNDGSWYLNLGDTYLNGKGVAHGIDPKQPHSRRFGVRPTDKQIPGLKNKDLIGIPWRVALALQADGWIVRSAIPWLKGNSMPESVNDRPNTAHETIFLLVKSPRYYFDMNAVRRPSAGSTIERDRYSRITSGKDGQYAVSHDHETPSHEGGRHLRTNDFADDSLDVLIAHHEGYLAHLRKVRDDGGMLVSEAGDPLGIWCSLVGFSGSHYATWPAKLVEPMIRASTSDVGCCPACGANWVRVMERGKVIKTKTSGRGWLEGITTQKNWVSGTPTHSGLASSHVSVTNTICWQPSCTCPAADPVPATILDPFMGSGTTLAVARQLGRRAIGLDLDWENFPMAEGRIADALRPRSRLDPPPSRAPLPGQLEMFTETSR